MNVFSLPRTEEDAIKLFQAKGILPKMRHCDQGHEMTLLVVLMYDGAVISANVVVTLVCE